MYRMCSVQDLGFIWTEYLIYSVVLLSGVQQSDSVWDPFVLTASLKFSRNFWRKKIHSLGKKNREREREAWKEEAKERHTGPVGDGIAPGKKFSENLQGRGLPLNPLLPPLGISSCYFHLNNWTVGEAFDLLQPYLIPKMLWPSQPPICTFKDTPTDQDPLQHQGCNSWLLI